MVADCNKGKAHVFFDFGMEHNATYADFKRLHDWMDSNKLQDFTVIYACMGVNAASSYDKFCKKNNLNKRAHVCTDPITIIMHTCCYFGNMVALKRKRLGYFTSNYHSKFGITIAYQFYSDIGLRENTLLTCSTLPPNWGIGEGDTYSPEYTVARIIKECQEWELPYDKHLVEEFTSKLYNNEFTILPQIQFNRGINYLNQACDFVVIRESSRYNYTNDLVTEKTYKAFQTRQPFVIIGSGKILDTLKNQGYRTFDKWIDESYNCNDPVHMLRTVMKEARRIQKMEDLEFRKMLFEMHDILEHNYNVFYEYAKHERFYLK